MQLTKLYGGLLMIGCLNPLCAMEKPVMAPDTLNIVSPSIPPLKKLAAREIYAANSDCLKEFLEEKNMSQECKDLISNSLEEMFNALNKFIRDGAIASAHQLNNSGTALRYRVPADDEIVIEWPYTVFFDLDLNNNKFKKDQIIQAVADSKRLDLIRLMNKMGMRMDDYVELLTSAIKEGKLQSVKSILECKIIPLPNKFYGWPLLCAAVDSNNQYHSKIAALLLENGCDVNAQEDLTGNTPLILAATTRCCSCTQLLLKHRAALEAKNDKGETALVQAVQSRSTDVSKLLIEHHANIDVFCNNKALFDYAKEERLGQIVRLLRIEHIKNPEQKIVKKINPVEITLHYGSQQKQGE